jgi:hypothetical protein
MATTKQPSSGPGHSGQTGDPAIDKLNLEPAVAQKALQLKHEAPGVVFTSGRRSVTDQARAMAQNVAKRRDFIQKTYVPSPGIHQLQQWVNSHPEATTVSEIAAGLEHVMNGLPQEQLLHISKHLTGHAFDVKPHSCTVSQIEALHPAKFLQHEAGLERWHVQF